MDDYGVGILTGGKSRRMGQNKALLRWRGETLLGRLIREFSGGELLLSAAAPGIYEGFGCGVVYDEHPGLGPMEGLRRLLTETKSDWLFVCAADMPLLRRETADFLAAFRSSDYDCCVATCGGRVQPLCALYSRAVLPAAEACVAGGFLRLRDLLDRVRVKYVPLEYSRLGVGAAANINTPEDLRRLSGPRVLCVCGEKNTGKTTLVCRLIEALRAEGARVAAIKHDGHDAILDAPGTDTARFTAAGADAAAVFTATRCSLFAANPAEPEALLDALSRLSPPPDVVLIEGMKASDYPKLELRRGDGSPAPVAAGAEPLLVVTEDAPAPSLAKQAVQRDDIGGILRRLRRFWEEEA